MTLPRTNPDAPPPPGPVPVRRRSLAPDLARGVMLLVIATAHAHMFAQMSGGADAVSGTWDRVATGAMTLFSDFRGYPMFAALFGYGLAQIHRSRTAQGKDWPWTRRLLRRRGLWMIAFGAVHVALLFYGDILAIYGLLALAFVGAVRLSDRGLLRAAGAALAVATLFILAVGAASGGDPMKPEVPEGFLGELGFRFTMWPFMIVFMTAATAFPFLIGIWAARKRLLERPAEHLPLLRRTALTGIPIAVVGGLPHALHLTGVWADPGAAAAVLSGLLHQVSGFAGGFGYAAVIALVAVRIGARRSPAADALAALGQRSLTFYLLQSVAWTVLFASYGLDLQVSTAAGVGIGAAVWLATVVPAGLMGRAGWRGPAEVALRRLTYGPAPATRGA